MLLVQCDFDNTITVGNVSTMIREAFAPPQWKEMDQEYLAGKYSVEESNVRQFALIRASPWEIEELVARQVEVRAGFAEFVGYCGAEGIGFVMVSSGLDLYIRPTMGRLGLGHLEVHSAQAEVTPSGILVRYAAPTGEPLTRGFKESYLRHFKKAGHTVVYIGDGLSDVVPAREADFVMARGILRDRLSARGVGHYPFEDFGEARLHLRGIRRQLGV